MNACAIVAGNARIDEDQARDWIKQAQQLLDGGTTLSSGAAQAGIDLADLRDLQLLTAKPFLYVFNVDVAELADEDLSKFALRVGLEIYKFQADLDSQSRLVSVPVRMDSGKTQVFIDPAGDHYRTRMTHTLETSAIARGVARALRLNEDLVEAIGLGHDTGHPPFGHAGEEALDHALNERFGRRFRHNEQSLRIAESLNLTEEVRDGILTHTGSLEPSTLEGKIVRIVDRVAYINHDIDDAVRFGILDPADLPQAEGALLGERGSRRIDTLVHDLVESSERGLSRDFVSDARGTTGTRAARSDAPKLWRSSSRLRFILIRASIMKLNRTW